MVLVCRITLLNALMAARSALSVRLLSKTFGQLGDVLNDQVSDPEPNIR